MIHELELHQINKLLHLFYKSNMSYRKLHIKDSDVVGNYMLLKKKLVIKFEICLN